MKKYTFQVTVKNQASIPIATLIIESESLANAKDCANFLIDEEEVELFFVSVEEKTVMTERQRILALEAACCAAECCLPNTNISAAISLLQDEFEHYGKDEVFEKYLKDQKEAVILLANSPECFGAE